MRDKIVRIGYEKMGEIERSELLLLGSRVVFVEVNRKTKRYEVKDEEDENVIYLSGQCANVEKCKRQVRDRLSQNQVKIVKERKK